MAHPVEEIWHVDELKEICSPTLFYDRYIATRQPMILKNQCATLLNNPSILELDVPMLLDVAESKRNCCVEVNQAAQAATDQETSFSPLVGSKTIEMPFSELCQKLKEKCKTLYMTTQTLPMDDEGRPAVTSWLTDCLLRRNLIPLRPDLLGHLIPMNAGNVWMGRSSSSGCSGTKLAVSSGLHHDFHDNLYCLIRGEKTIRVAPPSSVHVHTMTGELHTLYDNGRIVYREQVKGVDPTTASSIRPDGADRCVERILALELRKEKVENEMATIKDEDRQTVLGEELEEIEEKLLDIEMENGSADGDDHSDDSCTVRSHSDDQDSGTKRKRQKLCTNEPSCVPPPNFVSRENPTKYQLIKLQAGDAIYLPAGWFHEVFSAGDECHIAINYWVHPPDSGSPFEKPYKSLFWQHDWDGRNTP